MYIIIQVVIIVVLFFLSAWFSTTESALMSLSRVRIKKIINESYKKAKGLKVWLENPNQVITTILIGNNIVNVSVTAIATSFTIQISEIYGFNRAVAVTISAVLITLILVIFSEVSAKIFGIHNSEKFVLFSIIPLYYLNKLLTPISDIFAKIGGFIAGQSSTKKIPVLTHEDIKTTISIGHQIGVFGVETKRMMHSVLNFPQVTAKMIMTPREKMEVINVDTEKEKFIDLVVETGHSRVPVYKDTSDNIIGIIYARDLLDMWRAGEVFTVGDLLRPVFFVEETKKINELMKQFKKGESHVAIVKNSQNKIVGLITIEDIIEEVFGEILDEYDVEGLFRE
ncbi:MAG: HlyC/CorC family transporter [Elusimicrobia bacterium]|nr:HlyC/CorC family transporter [Elusimicrobiota bacterium]